MAAEIETWRRRGEAARLAHESVNRAFREHVREREPDRYAALLQDFWSKTAAALPSTEPAFMPGLAKGHFQAVETGIAFLEADPWFFRSGYEKQNIIRHMKRVQLSASQRMRLAWVVLRAIDGRDRVEFRHFCRLACGVWSDQLDEEVAARMQSRDASVRRRARWVAEAAISAGKA